MRSASAANASREERQLGFQQRSHGDCLEDVRICCLGARLLAKSNDRLILGRTKDQIGEVQLEDGRHLEQLVWPRKVDTFEPVGDGLSRYVLPVGGNYVVTIANYQIDNLLNLIQAVGQKPGQGTAKK